MIHPIPPNVLPQEVYRLALCTYKMWNRRKFPLVLLPPPPLLSHSDIPPDSRTPTCLLALKALQIHRNPRILSRIGPLQKGCIEVSFLFDSTRSTLVTICRLDDYATKSGRTIIRTPLDNFKKHWKGPSRSTKYVSGLRPPCRILLHALLSQSEIFSQAENLVCRRRYYPYHRSNLT